MLHVTDPKPFAFSTDARGEIASERLKAMMAAQQAAEAKAREVSNFSNTNSFFQLNTQRETGGDLLSRSRPYHMRAYSRHVSAYSI